MAVESYRDLIVWKKSIQLVEIVYQSTEFFPHSEKYILTAQMRRAAISISSNIAEGSRRGSRKDFRNFLINAFGSGAELETQLEICKRLKFMDRKNFLLLATNLSQIMKMLNSLIAKLQPLSTHYKLPSTH